MTPGFGHLPPLDGAQLITGLGQPTYIYIISNGRSPEVASAAAVYGYTTVFWWGAGIFAVGALILTVIHAPRRPDPRGAVGRRRTGRMSADQARREPQSFEDRHPQAHPLIPSLPLNRSR